MPEAPLPGADEPDRLPPFSLGWDDDIPPIVHMPPVPTNELRPLADADDAEKLVEAIAAGKFANANPQFRKWEYRRPGAEARRATLARQTARLKRHQHRTAFFKTVAAGKEPDFQASLYTTLQQAALCVLSVVTLASALNVGANYAIESGAWSSLVEQPWTAFLFVLVAPAGGLAAILCLSLTLETDHGQKRLAQVVAGLTLIAWVGWLIEFGRLYGLQSVIGDSGGRALPPRVMDEVRDLHSWMLILQITAEVLSGAAFKLLWCRVHWRNILVVVVPGPVLAFIETRYDFFCDAENRAAGYVGDIDDYLENYRKGLASFTAACQAELRRLKNAASAVEAAARAEFIAASHASAVPHEIAEVGS